MVLYQVMLEEQEFMQELLEQLWLVLAIDFKISPNFGEINKGNI